MAGRTNAVNGQFAGNNNFMPSSYVLAGNPNTVTGGQSHVGQIGDIYFDTVGLIGYTCTVGGASGTAVWTAEAAATGSFNWVNTTANTQAMAVNTGYVNNSTALGVYTLPTTASVGQRVAVSGASTFGWQIAQNVSQTIAFNGGITTAGTGGTLSSTGQYDVVILQCIVASTGWKILEVTGNLAYV